MLPISHRYTSVIINFTPPSVIMFLLLLSGLWVVRIKEVNIIWIKPFITKTESIGIHTYIQSLPKGQF